MCWFKRNPREFGTLDSTPWIPDPSYRILISLSVEHGVRIPFLYRDPDSLGCIPDSKDLDFEFHEKNISDSSFPIPQAKSAGIRDPDYLIESACRSFSLSRNKKINWKPSSGRRQENECYKRLLYKQFFQVSGLCGPQFLSYLPKRFTHLCRALYGDTILVYRFGAPISPPEINKNTWSSFFL